MDTATTGVDVAITADITQLRQQFADASKLSAQFGASLSQSFADIAVKGRSLNDTLRSLTSRLSEMTLKAAFKPLTDQLGSALSGLLGLAGVPGAGGGAVTSLAVPFADGGVIASPITFPLAGNRTGVAGEAGAEAILPLTRSADGSLGVRSAGGAGPTVTFNVTSPDADSFRRSETQIAAMLSRVVAQGQRNL